MTRLKRGQLRTNFEKFSEYSAVYTEGKIQASENGDTLYCQTDEKINVLQCSTGKILRSIGTEGEPITCFVLSPSQEILVIATRHLLLKSWNPTNGTLLRQWKAIHAVPINTMLFDDTSTLLATGGTDGTIKVWDVVRQYCTHNLRGHQGVVTCLRFHPTKLLLYTCAEDLEIRVWDLQESSCISRLSAHHSVITCLEFSADKQWLFSASRDSVVVMWSASTYERQKTIPVYDSVEGLVLLDPDANYPALKATSGTQHFITAGSKGDLKVWNASTAQNVFTEEGNEAILGLICTQSAFVVFSADRSIRLLALDDLRKKKQFVGHNDDILDIQYAGDNEDIVAVATNSSQVKLFEEDSWSCTTLEGHSDTVLCLDSCKKTKTLATASKDNTIGLWTWDENGFTSAGFATGHTSAVRAIALSRLERSFAVSGGQDTTLKLWVTSEGRLSAKLTVAAHDKDINSLAVSPNDQLIISGSQDKTAKLWNAGDLSLVTCFRGHKRSIWCARFSPVDQAAATSSADGTIKLWSLSDFTCVKTLEGHDASVLKICFISRGTQLASSGSEGLVKVWSVRTSECVCTLDAHSDSAWALVAKGDGERLVSGGADSTVILWKDITESQLEEARAKQEESLLQEQEVQNLLHSKRYLKALKLAIGLEQPFRTLTILKEILAQRHQSKLEKTISKLEMHHIDSLLRFAIDWNTNSKHCHVAQHVISIVFSNWTSEELLELPSLKDAVEGLIPYTEKHLHRMELLQQQTCFIEFTRACMKPGEANLLSGGLLSTDLGRSVSAPASTVNTASDDTKENTVAPLTGIISDDFVNSKDSLVSEEAGAAVITPNKAIDNWNVLPVSSGETDAPEEQQCTDANGTKSWSSATETNSKPKEIITKRRRLEKTNSQALIHRKRRKTRTK